jgi:hypothetical protein
MIVAVIKSFSTPTADPMIWVAFVAVLAIAPFRFLKTHDDTCCTTL